MSLQEQIITLAGKGFEMLGILSLPPVETPTQHTAILIVVGGAQYRVGSHRQFVRLARQWATAGHPVLRFDLPGMGDSPGEPVPFEETAPCIAAALEALQRHGGHAGGAVLWGLCDGASASLLYVQATQDPRVTGLALLNPWVRSEAGLARAQVKHYYRQRLLQADFWRKLLRGGIGWQALQGLATKLQHLRSPSSPPPAGFQELMAQGWQAFGGPILLLLSERDLTAQEFIEHAHTSPGWRLCLQKASLSRHTICHADHTCAQPQAHQAVALHTQDWLYATLRGH
ncbi:hydrolase 1, exosortase A system-associated [Simplicispira psychrophila]|uniref:hydrolase 1, exosortase A system-associated n=1 Tax=Simplicispira psychrophila TaxID=80882 RepID=UPI0005613AD0|nr:hydrolase 1, exosortase A system-associated [Simplicispira psychrophila]